MPPMILPSRFERGFTLIGMAMIIVTLSVSVALIFSVLQPSLSTSANNVTIQRANMLRDALKRYLANHYNGAVFVYPPDLTTLVMNDNGDVACAFQNNPAANPPYLSLQGWCGPYIDQVFQNAPNDFKTDGWGTAFQFTTATGVLTSCGPDRTCPSGDDIVFNP